jgi:hypothetical protein
MIPPAASSSAFASPAAISSASSAISIGGNRLLSLYQSELRKNLFSFLSYGFSGNIFLFIRYGIGWNIFSRHLRFADSAAGMASAGCTASFSIIYLLRRFGGLFSSVELFILNRVSRIFCSHH